MSYHVATFITCWIACFSTLTVYSLVPLRHQVRPPNAVLNGAVAVETGVEMNMESLSNELISKLRFRAVRQELERRALDTSGTLSAMKNRLREAALGLKSTNVSIENEEARAIDMGRNVLDEAMTKRGISFQDTSDPDFDFKNLVKEISSEAERVHWKTATRRLRKLTRSRGKSSTEGRSIPAEVYLAVLTACMEDRLHGARAAESARKIMELMAEDGYEIPSEAANFCLRNCLDDGPDSTHDGFGGIDTALAILAAFENSPSSGVIQEDIYTKLATSMAKSGSLDDSLQMLRAMVVEKSFTPNLQVFAEVASGCVAKRSTEAAEKVMTVLAYAKAAGYELESIASTVDGRALLATGVIAAEKLNNVGLGLRFLTAASKAKGCDPDRGDALVSTHSPAAQRASTILHREAVFRASQDMAWQLAVKLLELMLERGLVPSPGVWRNVVTVCSKAEKSRKATSVLLDWVELAKQGRMEKPSLRVFNTVMNVCEVCGEEDLTIKVLDAMQETHDTEGNLITFNIALKRLAKQGNNVACEGIIIGMLQNGIEPSVVTYTTAVASCVAEPKKSDIAVEWIKRMRSRRVQPNVITYNTAFASCLDGTLEGTKRASKLASEMVTDIQRQVDSGVLESDEYTNIIPDFYTRTLARELMKQLKTNWENGEIDKQVAKSTLRVPLLELVEFMKTDLAEMAEKQKDYIKNATGNDSDEATVEDDAVVELEYSTAISSHRAAAV